jgi:hypothetical protein
MNHLSVSLCTQPRPGTPASCWPGSEWSLSTSSPRQGLVRLSELPHGLTDAIVHQKPSTQLLEHQARRLPQQHSGFHPRPNLTQAKLYVPAPAVPARQCRSEEFGMIRKRSGDQQRPTAEPGDFGPHTHFLSGQFGGKGAAGFARRALLAVAVWASEHFAHRTRHGLTMGEREEQYVPPPFPFRIRPVGLRISPSPHAPSHPRRDCQRAPQNRPPRGAPKPARGLL